LDPRFKGSNPEGNVVFLKAIKVFNKTSFEREVKPSAPCKILLRVKEPYEYERDNLAAKFTAISRPVSPCFVTKCF
jgi:hypothetical protein